MHICPKIDLQIQNSKKISVKEILKISKKTEHVHKIT